MAKSRHARCVDLAGGDFVAGSLLHQIVYWHPKATIREDGLSWVAKSRGEWSEETSIPLHTLDRALAKLKGKGLIETRKKVFKGRVGMQLSLSKIGLRRCQEEGLLQKCEDASSQISENPSSQMCEHLYTETTKTEITEQIICAAVADAEAGAQDQGGSEAMKPKGQFTVADVVNKPKPKPEMKTDDKVSVLETVWKGEVSQLTGEYVPPLTQKARGQLKHVLKACPKGTASRTLTKVVRHWPKFVEAVKEATGQAKVPGKPNLDFLVKHVAVAINFTPSTGLTIAPAKSDAVAAAPSQVQIPKVVGGKEAVPEEEHAEIDKLLEDF